MKMFIASVFLFTCLGLFGQEYNKLVEEGNSWSTVNWSWGWGWTDYLFLDGDTIINDTAYTKVYYTSDSTLQNDVSFHGGIREDTITKEIFFYYNTNLGEIRLYKFGMSIGDTALVSSMACYPIHMIVAEVDTITDEQGIQRRRMLMDNWYDWYDEYWIEGIGSTLGLLTAGNFSCIADYNQELLCFSRNDELSYMNPLYTKCNITQVSITETEIIRDGIKVCPNPVTGISKIVVNDDIIIRSFKVFDSRGIIIYEPSIINPNINKGFLKPGIYFLKAEIQNGGTTSIRFVVQ